MKVFQIIRHYHNFTIRKYRPTLVFILVYQVILNIALATGGEYSGGEIVRRFVQGVAFQLAIIVVFTWIFAFVMEMVYSRRRPGFWKARHLRAVEVITIHHEDDSRGWRFAHLGLRPDGQLTFGPINHFGSFEVTHTASCYKGHRAPDPKCECGFYSLKKLQHFASLVDYRVATVLLECRYFGRVIPGSRGFRAERQQVVRVWLQPECVIRSCDNDAVQVALMDLFRVTEDAPMPEDVREVIHLLAERIPVLSLCDHHSMAGSDMCRTFTAQQLREELRTEVEWAPRK